jgi:hypothetical protein
MRIYFRIQTCGIGQISPNTILLGWPKVDSDDPDIANNFTSNDINILKKL